MTEKQSRRFWIIAAFMLVVLTLLFYSLRVVIRETIILPITYWVFVGTRFLRSTPQLYFYIMIVIITVVMAYRSFKNSYKADPPVPKVPDIGPVGGRLSYWDERVSLMRLGPFYQTIFNESLARLALDLLLYRNRMSNRELENAITSGRMQMPDEVNNFLLKFALRREYTPVSWFAYLYRSLRLWFYSRIRSKRQTRDQDILQSDALRTIQYIEKELEINHDTRLQ